MAEKWSQDLLLSVQLLPVDRLSTEILIKKEVHFLFNVSFFPVSLRNHCFSLNVAKSFFTIPLNNELRYLVVVNTSLIMLLYCF